MGIARSSYYAEPVVISAEVAIVAEIEAPLARPRRLAATGVSAPSGATAEWS